MDKANRITLDDLGREPFRIFFPEGVFAGILGVALWPLYFTGVTGFYPGQAHARIMAYGLFGGFIFGFLGTAMPRKASLASRGRLFSLSSDAGVGFNSKCCPWASGFQGVCGF